MPLKPSEMSVEDLLHALAFCREEYTPETLAAMEVALAAKGCRQRHVRSWREQFLLVDSADSACESCGRELVLDEDELISGRFNCPRCGHSQEVNYRELKPTAYPADLPASLAATSENSKSGRVSDKIANEALLQTFALEGYRFKPGIRDNLRRLFVIRGYCRADIRAWREKNIPDQIAEITCVRCRTRQTISRGAIVEGEFTCTSCNRTQPVRYRWLEPFDALADQSHGANATASGETPIPDVDSLSDMELLETLAMGGDNFPPNVRETMIQKLELRGYSRKDLQAWREGRPLNTEIPESSLAAFKPGGALGGGLVGLCLFLVGLLALLMIMIGLGSNIPGMADRPLLFDGSAIRAADLSVAVVMLGIGILEIILPLLFLFWYYRVYRNVAALTSKPTVIRPGFAIAAFFIPVADFIVPYLMAREILQCGLPVDSGYPSSGQKPSPALAKWWWGICLADVGYHLALAIIISDTWIAQTSWLLLASTGLDLLVTAFTARLVYVIDHLQSAIFASRGGAPPV